MNRRILSIILAVLLAVVGTTAVLVYVSRADARALEGKEAVAVLVATEPIPAGTTAAAAKQALRAENMPAASVPSDVVASIDDNLADLVTSTDLATGQLLTRGMLVTKSSQSSIVLPKGMLAVTIPLSGGDHGGDQIKTGFKVAVFDTFTVGDNNANGFTPSGEQLAFGEDKNQATRLLLPEVEVIDVLAEKPRGEDGSGGFGKYLVTVAVTQPAAERLIHALNTGTVSLAQVNDDSDVKRGRGVDNNKLFTNGG